MPARPSCYEWCVTLTQLEAFVLVARLGVCESGASAHPDRSGYIGP